MIGAGDLDHLGELSIALGPAADVPGIDAVFGQRRGTVRVLEQQLVAVEVEIADQGHGAAERVKPIANMRHGGGGLRGVDRNAHQFRAGRRQLRALIRGRGDIGRVGVGHRLHDDRGIAADRTRPTCTARLKWRLDPMPLL